MCMYTTVLGTEPAEGVIEPVQIETVKVKRKWAFDDIPHVTSAKDVQVPFGYVSGNFHNNGRVSLIEWKFPRIEM